MSFELLFTTQAGKELDELKNNPAKLKRYKAVIKTLGYLETNPKHPSLSTHKFFSLHGPNSEVIFEVYAENKTPAAYRVFWYYGPDRSQMTILAITPHQ